MRKAIALAIILTGILVFSVFNTLVTKAITLEEVQAQIQQLLQAINSLKVQIQTINQTSTSVQSQPSTSTCPFVSIMYRGYSESPTAETTELQKFLKQYPSIYPEGLVTGYFGRLTEAAVSRFQTQYGIQVTGQVGPQTRAKLCSFWQGGISIGNCGWCGNTCVRKTAGMSCADVIPPAGYRCAENGVSGECEISQLLTTSASSSLPDLTITDLTCSPNNNIQLGQSTQCNITIHNSSSVDASTHKLEAFVGGKSAYSVYGIVRAGQTEQATFSWQCTEAGDFTVKAVVDSENIIQESNETNNEKTISICCGGTCIGLPTSNLPDLVIDFPITDLTPITLNIGETTEIVAFEENIGSVAAGHHFTGIFEDNIETPLNYIEINTILPGYKAPIFISAPYTCYKVGTHTVTAMADYIHQVATGQVLESNENNNSQIITITCGNQVATTTTTTTTTKPSTTITTTKPSETVSFTILVWDKIKKALKEEPYGVYDAKVTLTNLSTGKTITCGHWGKSGNLAKYHFDNIPKGKYTLKITKAGYYNYIDTIVLPDDISKYDGTLNKDVALLRIPSKPLSAEIIELKYLMDTIKNGAHWIVSGQLLDGTVFPAISHCGGASPSAIFALDVTFKNTGEEPIFAHLMYGVTQNPGNPSYMIDKYSRFFTNDRVVKPGESATWQSNWSSYFPGNWNYTMKVTLSEGDQVLDTKTVTFSVKTNLSSLLDTIKCQLAEVKDIIDKLTASITGILKR